MIKVFVMVSVTLSAIIIAIILKTIYLMRIRVFSDFKYLITIFMQEVAFKKTLFESCYNSNITKLSSYSNQVISEYLKSKKKRYLCTKSDFFEIYDFIDSVAMGDVDYTIATSKYYLTSIELKLDTLEKEYKTSGLLYFKLIIIVGIGIAILIL